MIALALGARLARPRPAAERRARVGRRAQARVSAGGGVVRRARARMDESYCVNLCSDLGVRL